MNVRDFGNLECEEKLLRTCLFVEATRNETHGLWNSPVPCLRHLQDYDWFARV